jgi:hypothetical protein
MTRQITLLMVLAMTPIAFAGSPQPDEGIAFIRLRAVELDNRLEPNGKEWELSKFRVQNLQTGKVYSGTSPDRPLAKLVLPAGFYCLYSVFPYVNQELRFGLQPYFEVKAGKINNLGAWTIGIDFSSGTLKLTGAFETPDDVLRIAEEKYSDDFD